MRPQKVKKYSKAYSKFIFGIATNPDKMEKFRANPLPVAKAAGLTQEEMLIIISRKTRAILARLDPASIRDTKAFHVEVHVEIQPTTSSPCCEPNWAILPSEKTKKGSKRKR